MATRRTQQRQRKQLPDGFSAFILSVGSDTRPIRAGELGELLLLLESFIRRYELHMLRNEPIISQGLVINSAFTNSPLKFMGYCSGSALVLLSVAVSIGGGDAEISKGKFHINSVADAIAKLRRAQSEPPAVHELKSKELSPETTIYPSSLQPLDLYIPQTTGYSTNFSPVLSVPDKPLKK